MDQTQPATPARSSARRRLLRGSFSLPAVLAVHNGSALAARSNQFRCVLNQTPASGGVAPKVLLQDHTDNLDWMRVARYKVINTSSPFFVLKSDLEFVASNAGLTSSLPTGASSTGPNGLGAAKWFKWNPNQATAAPDNGSLLVADGSVAVLFKSSGSPPNVVVQVVGFVDKNMTTAAPFTGASTRSCWASIKP